MSERDDFTKIVRDAFFEKALEYFQSNIQEVAHYTSSEGLLNIVTNKELWFGNVTDLNDLYELNYGFEQVIKPILLSYDKISKAHKEKIITIIEELKNNHFTLPTTQGSSYEDIRIFILSTSEKENSHNLWNNYTKQANRGGYSIVFDYNALNDSIERAFRKNQNKEVLAPFISGKIIYKKSEQERIVLDYLKDVEYHLQNKSISSQDIILRAIAEYLLVFAIFMKDEDFASETEYRFAVIMADSRVQKYEDKDKQYPALKFITADGCIYSRLAFPFDNRIIKKIVISPYISNQEQAKNSLSFFLKKNGLNNVEIEAKIDKKCR